MKFRWTNIILVAVLATLLVSGCAHKKSYHSQVYDEDMYAPGGGEVELAGVDSIPEDWGKSKKDKRVAYTVGPDDVLNVIVRQHGDIGGEFIVSPEGTIFIPLIGSVDVEDASTEGIRERLESRLGEFIRDPEVGVSVATYNSKKIYVVGQVTRPGEYSMKGNELSLMQALLDAGLPLGTANLKHVAVITPDDYVPEVRLIDINKIIYKGIMKDNIDLQEGDLVVVHRHLLAKLGEFLNQILGPTTRLRSVADLAETFDGN